MNSETTEVPGLNFCTNCRFREEDKGVLHWLLLFIPIIGWIMFIGIHFGDNGKCAKFARWNVTTGRRELTSELTDCADERRGPGATTFSGVPLKPGRCGPEGKCFEKKVV